MNDAAFIICLVIGTIFLGYLGEILMTVDKLHDQAAKTECAQYHPVTGEFEWITKK